MTRPRKRIVYRSPIHRARLWDRKMDGATYAAILDRVKPIALPQFAQYQVVHEHIITEVKRILERYPGESGRAHAYVWYAQGIWYVTQRYKDEAMRKEADSLYLYWYLLGLNSDALREIAWRFGVDVGAKITQDCIEGIDEAITLRSPLIYRNPLEMSYDYDPATGRVSKVTIRDLVTNEVLTRTIEYDAEGNVAKIDEVRGQ